jgi:pantetheine-phosphate adenylyltransferase
MRIGIYPGTFDPMTLGHLDMVRRASQLCDKLIVAVAENPGKKPLFSMEERAALIKSEIANLGIGTDISGTDVDSKIEVKFFTGLLTDFARKESASMVIRGLRAVADFEYEFQMASANKRLNPNCETVFLTAAEQQHFVASTLVKEVARYGGDVTSFVSEAVATALREKFS